MRAISEAKKQDVARTIELMGRRPLNPIGKCFDSAAIQLVFGRNNPQDMYICHGVGIANAPGQKGLRIQHAWLEFPSAAGTIALDTTWGLKQMASLYRENFQLQYCVTYSRSQFLDLWEKHNFPGPWDPKIVGEARLGEDYRESLLDVEAEAWCERQREDKEGA